MKRFRFLPLAILFLGSVALVGCNNVGQTSGPSGQTQQSGTAFILGTDAPLASVLAFQINVTGLTASDGVNTVPLLSGPQTVEFSRLNGLRTLLELQTLPAGTYTSVSATLANPVITYLDTSVSPAALKTIQGTLTVSSVQVHLAQPLVITGNGLMGLVVDFRLGNSLELSSTGDITGRVTPNLDLRVISPDATDAQIDELRGGVVSVDLTNKSFVMQGPRGRQITVATNAQTSFEVGEGLDQLNTNSIVQVSGSLQRSTLTLQATEVLILSKDRFLLGGLITDVRPATGAANQIDLLVRSELPDLSGIQPGQITTLGLNGNERYMIHNLRLPLAALLFDRGSLVPGQRISAGGVLVTTTTPPTLDTRRIWLQQQGLDGAWVPGSTDPSTGTFRFNAAGAAGQLLGPTVKVFTSPITQFNGLSGLGALSGTSPIRLRIVGLILKDGAGNPVVLARVVQAL
jgi:hypothetical protein